MKLDKNYKVRVTPEQSRKIQELLFVLGGGWFRGHDGKHPAMLNADYLFLHRSMVLTYAYEHGNCYFENKPNYTEIQADDLIALLTDLSKSAENALQKMELTPEFETEASEPKFKVGDSVYCPSLLDGRIYKARKNNNYLGDGCKLFVANEHEDCFDFEADGSNQYNNPIVYHATEENRQALQVLHPDIEFEQPPKLLTGSDLCFEKLRNGKKLVMCAVSDLSDEKAIKRLEDDGGFIRIIKDCDPAPYHFIDTHGIRHGFAVPLNDETGEPLTEAVLDE